MKNNVKAIPEGYRSITPYLIAHHAAEAIEFYKNVFGALEVMRMPMPGNKIGHAELMIGDSKIMIADECAKSGARSAKALGGCPMMIHLYVENADKTIAQALAAGAALVRQPEDMFYGDRSGMVEDPYGYKWCISTHIEDVSDEEMEKRSAALFAKA